MSSHIITVAQQKGGAGKTSLAVHLATTWSLKGKSVAMVDIDPQGSLTRWYEIRRDNYGNTAVHPEVRTVTGWRVSTEVARLADHYDYVVIDSPPHTQTEAKIAIRAASLVLIPVQPSPMDLWATEPTIKLAVEENVPVMLVLNRVPPRAILTDEIRDQLVEFGAEIAQSRVGNRIVFAKSMLKGRGIGEVNAKSQAYEEFIALSKEVDKLLKRGLKAAA